MSCDYYSNAVFGQSDQMLPNALSEHRIDADRRLVQHQEWRLVDQSRGQRDASLLTAAQFT